MPKLKRLTQYMLQNSFVVESIEVVARLVSYNNTFCYEEEVNFTKHNDSQDDQVFTQPELAT